ncbi:Nif3-like dinuclear metal center hexameric protein [Christensenellaceae bacterium OttesenSCG-928-L17]|nr:Nif3-like dinuclear metal center hexameric protein [Christensenellaceae bacterium OttesenSCG-928-L17]
MRLEIFLNMMEQLAPRALAEEWDNPGLLVEPEQTEITRILVALDCTVDVANEAKEKGAQLVLTHHPLFFHPVRRIHYSDPATAAAYALVRQGIGLYAAHTNLDSALHGVNDALAAALGLQNIQSLMSPEIPLTWDNASLGRVGTLAAEMPLGEFAAYVRGRLSAAVRYGGDAARPVRRVAVLGGSGGDYLMAAKQAGADVLVTGEARHNQALDAAVLNIGIVEAGHFETERVVLAPLIASLQKKLDAVQYKVDLLQASCEKAPLIAP